MDTAAKLQKFEETYRNSVVWDRLSPFHTITLMTAGREEPDPYECMVYLEVINILVRGIASEAQSELAWVDENDLGSTLEILGVCLACTEYMALMYQVAWEQSWRAHAPQNILDMLDSFISDLAPKLESLRNKAIEIGYHAS